MKSITGRRRKVVSLLLCTLAAGSAATVVFGDRASATALCETHKVYGYVWVPGSGWVVGAGVSLTCTKITGGERVRGTLDCRFAPDPNTHWVSTAPSTAHSSNTCFSTARGTRIELS